MDHDHKAVRELLEALFNKKSQHQTWDEATESVIEVVCYATSPGGKFPADEDADRLGDELRTMATRGAAVCPPTPGLKR